MNYTYPYTLPDLEVSVGLYAPLTARLHGPAPLQVEFLFEPGEPERLTDAAGDPGEPGRPDFFDFKRVLATRPLVLTTDADLTVVVALGADLSERLSPAVLARIEIDLLRQLREDADENRADLLVIDRFADLGALK